ncbi:MAG TPA: hypothetical protein VMH26_07765 [Burkholderiales bacterium]|nr:hypothetical protein [Burkholderiales bacterium]
MDKVKASMAALIAKTGKLGAPKIEGTDPVGGKSAPGLYFGTTKMNNFFDVVDEVVKENGGTATLFVKAGDEYVSRRAPTNTRPEVASLEQSARVFAGLSTASVASRPFVAR